MASSRDLEQIAFDRLNALGVPLDESGSALLRELIQTRAVDKVRAMEVPHQQEQQRQDQQQQQQQYQQQQHQQQQIQQQDGDRGGGGMSDREGVLRFQSSIDRLGGVLRQSNGAPGVQASALRAALGQLCPGFWPFC